MQDGISYRQEFFGNVCTATADNWNKSFNITSIIVHERLANKRPVWCTKPQSPLRILNIYFRLTGFQPLILLVYFRYSPLWQRVAQTYPILWRFSFKIDAAQLRSANGTEITTVMWEQKHYLYVFSGARVILYSVNMAINKPGPKQLNDPLKSYLLSYK